MKVPRILNVGSINMDMVINVDKMPEAGQTLFGEKYCYIPGGKGANQGVAAARLGAQVTFLGRVGDDDFGRTMIENFKKDNIDTSLITVDKNSSTGVAVIPVESSGQNRIIVISGANMEITESDIDIAFQRDFDAVTIGLEVPLNVVYYTYKKASEKGIPVVLDAGPAMKLDLSPLKGIDVISPNETECLAMTGIEPSSEQAALLAAEKIYSGCNAKNVVIKLGGRGSYLYKNGVGKIIPAVSGVKVKDTTAAGDCFTAALATMLIKTGDIECAIEYATKAAAICISRFGAQPSLPYENEI
ncbi:MAG: ribokinase [Clostridia bacterium]|nr:ribokinase [Clostridia bacterium]